MRAKLLAGALVAGAARAAQIPDIAFAYLFGVVVVVAIGRHEGPEFYSALAEDLDIRPVGQGREQKPPCC